MRGPIRYAQSGDVSIAYQVTGDGPFDLVLVPGFTSHLEFDWEEPRHAAFLERLASFSRLIRLDKRGTGLSDRHGGIADLETRMDDVRAVMDAVGTERAALFGYWEGGPMSILFAATYPERTRALALCGTFATAPNHDLDEEQRAAIIDDVVRQLGRRRRDPPLRARCRRRDEGMVGRPGARRRQSRRHPEPHYLDGDHRRPRRPPARAGAHARPPHDGRAPVPEWRRGASSRTRSPARGWSSCRARARCRGSTPSRSWTRSRSSSRAPGRRPSPIASWRRSSSRTSSARRRRLGRSATRHGRASSSSTTRPFDASSTDSPARRSTPPGTASSPSSTGRRERFAARSASSTRSRRWASRSVQVCTQARSSGLEAASRGASP